MTQLSRALQNLITDLPGRNAVRELLVVLAKRVIVKIRNLLQKGKLGNFNTSEDYFNLIGCTVQQAQRLLEEAQKLKTVQEQDFLPLYSSYSQNMSELIAVLLAPIVKQNQTCLLYTSPSPRDS
eukprot:TRINITY_DN3659_c0_g2_i5.p1 TRINITY_DN3659_c0_g2~~TRINITY_DN3659_c0_g2_i5.p1  ORF type:complete len:124 (+),score=19.27 TRINITY_DN3659_c0_g2_i5:2-373(+)